MQSDTPSMKIVKEDIVQENADPIKTANYITKAVSNPFRQKILSLLLANGKLAVFELCEKLDIEQSAMSQHLSILRQANLVNTERSGKYVRYFANEQYLQQLIDSILYLTRDLKK